jgi:hypothetical protein
MLVYMSVFPAPVIVVDNRPFLVCGRHGRWRMSPALAALGVLAQMSFRLIVSQRPPKLAVATTQARILVRHLVTSVQRVATPAICR